MNKIITAIIIEDSRLARLELKELLKQHANINIVAEAENADAGKKAITKHHPDLIFLDINMPQKDGFTLLQELDHVPTVIFTTAYDEFAIKAFEYNAFDYLLKPISQKRFDRTIAKLMPKMAKMREHARQKERQARSQIFIKEGENCWLVQLKDILMFEIMGNYTRVFFANKQPLVYKSLNQIEKTLPSTLFFRANRQQIINLNHIDKVEPWFKGSLKIILKNGNAIEASRRQSQQFKQLLEL